MILQTWKIKLYLLKFLRFQSATVYCIECQARHTVDLGNHVYMVSGYMLLGKS